MNSVLKIITAKNLTYSQKVVQLSRVGENCVDVLNVSEKFKEYHKKGILCDMNEGNAPFRPRYVMVDFDRFVKQGSKFLRIAPPQDLEELLNSLMILYRHIPSITTFPVYIGNIDTLINPFLDNVSDEKGPDHNKTFVVEVYLNSNCIGSGSGKSKKQAEQKAAKEALALMGYKF